jgi:RHS repeat-associated protein
VSSQQEWYLYDASGERVLRRSFDGTNTTLTVYAFGLEEHQYAYSGSGGTATNTSNTYYYDLGGQLLGTWDGTSPTTTFLLTDSLGSVVSSFNNPSSGAVMQGNQLYGPYGNQRLKQGSLSTNRGFTGQGNDGLTGLDYYGARYYDPTIGLFLSADDVEGNVMGMDPYSYVGGNPEAETDPTGNLVYSPETGQVAIPQPDGRDVITGYNAGLNGTFNPKVTYTPVAYKSTSFWSNSSSVSPSSASRPIGHKHLTPDQLNHWCSNNNQCTQDIFAHEYWQESQDTLNGMLFGLTLLAFFEGDPEAMQQTSEDALALEVQGQEYDNAILAKMDSPALSDQVEGQAGLIARMYSNLIKFNYKYGPNGSLGEVDAETPQAIIEAKSGGAAGQATDLLQKLNNPYTNPDGKPFVVYAPNWNDKNVQSMYQQLGSLDTGQNVYITTSDEQLIEVLDYLQS